MKSQINKIVLTAVIAAALFIAMAVLAHCRFTNENKLQLNVPPGLYYFDRICNYLFTPQIFY